MKVNDDKMDVNLLQEIIMERDVVIKSKDEKIAQLEAENKQLCDIIAYTNMKATDNFARRHLLGRHGIAGVNARLDFISKYWINNPDVDHTRDDPGTMFPSPKATTRKLFPHQQLLADLWRIAGDFGRERLEEIVQEKQGRRNHTFLLTFSPALFAEIHKNANVFLYIADFDEKVKHDVLNGAMHMK